MTGPYDVWVFYLRMKLHFRGQVDYFQHNLSQRFSRDAFCLRRDRVFFERLWEEHRQDSGRFMLSCFVGLKQTSGDIYVRDMLDDEHYQGQWKRFQKAEESLLGSFKNDLMMLLRREPDHTLKSAIKTTDKRLPLLIRRLLTYDFGIESYVILNKVVPVNGLYMKNYELDPRVSRVCSTASRYAPFINIPDDLVKQTIREVSKLEGI